MAGYAFQGLHLLKQNNKCRVLLLYTKLSMMQEHAALRHYLVKIPVNKFCKAEVSIGLKNNLLLHSFKCIHILSSVCAYGSVSQERW